jgi:phosphate-selective porin OprO and OprP
MPERGMVETGDGQIDMLSRLQELEQRAAESDSQLHALQDAAKKAETQKKKFPTAVLNGAFQADAVAFEQNDLSRDVYGPIESGADIRRARLGVSGSVSERMGYFFQMDFGFLGRPTFTDVWAEFKEVDALGNVRVGHWKQPFSLEVVSSYRYTTFMERAVTFQAFTPFRHLGVGFQDHSEDLNSTWAFSYLRTGQDQFAGSLSTDQGNGLAGRITHLPWYNDSGSDYLQLGLSYFLDAPPNGLMRLRSIPEIFVGEFAPDAEPRGTSGIPVPARVDGTPFFADTGLLTDVNLANTYGSEALWVRGPLSWQSELMGRHIDSAAISNALLWGGYTQIGLFLTGEHRPFDRKIAAIDRVIPFRSLNRNRDGWGAWELAVRWSYLDLIDRDVRGGEIENLTYGLNWFVNPYCRITFNYLQIHSVARRARSGVIQGNELIGSNTDAFGLRCQLDF